MTNIYITKYELLCNLGSCVEEAFSNALLGTTARALKNISLPKIDNPDFNLRSNQMLLYLVNKLNIYSLLERYREDRVAVVVATTNSGVEEFETSESVVHSELGNPALFLKNELWLKNYCSSVSTACTSGIKAFAIGKKLLENDICDAVIVGGVDSMSKLPVFGFSSLEVMSEKQSIPFSKNRSGMNIEEGAALFVLEKNVNKGVKLLSIGETSDAHHATTPDPNGVEAARAIEIALANAGLTSNDIDYINLHGTGTISNDIMESNAIYSVFKDNVYASSTKPLTGHCLGAASSVEVALCCAMLDKFNPKKQLLPHIYDGEYDETLPKIKLIEGEVFLPELKTVLCNSFGFGGTNAVAVLGV